MTLYLSAVAISLTLYEYLATILAFVGATSASFLAFILPSYLTIIFYRSGSDEAIQSITERSFRASCALLIFGVVALILGSIESLK